MYGVNFEKHYRLCFMSFALKPPRAEIILWQKYKKHSCQRLIPCLLRTEIYRAGVIFESIVDLVHKLCSSATRGLSSLCDRNRKNTLLGATVPIEG